MICHCCNNKQDDHYMSEYELKIGGKVSICVECKNTAEHYFNVIKRDCLIDEISYDVTINDEKQIRIERKQRLEKEDEEKQLDYTKSIFYFTNEPLKKPEYNHQVLKYINTFVGKDDSNEDHIQRFKFNYSIDKHWYVGDWDGLTGVNIYLDTVKKEYQRVRKDSSEPWRNRIRKWHEGRFECDEDFYNCTFGFSQYDDEDYGHVYADYDFLCSKSRKVSNLIEEMISND